MHIHAPTLVLMQFFCLKRFPLLASILSTTPERAHGRLTLFPTLEHMTKSPEASVWVAFRAFADHTPSVAQVLWRAERS